MPIFRKKKDFGTVEYACEKVDVGGRREASKTWGKGPFARESEVIARAKRGGEKS